MEEEISLREIIEVLIQGKWIIALITVIAVLTAGIFSFFIIPPTYEATATLMVSVISPKNQQMVSVITSENQQMGDDFQELIDSLPQYPQMTLETYRTQVENPLIIKDVIETLNLDPEKYSIASLKESITVNSIKDTNLIEIKVKNRDPKLASQIANLLAQKFVDFVSDSTKQQIGRSAQFIKTQLDKEKQNLDKAAEELKTFLAQPRGVNELQSEINSKIEQLIQFKTQLVALDVEEQETLASLGKAQSELEKQPRTLKTVKSISDDPYLSQLAQDKYDGKTSELSGLKMESEEINPVYIQLTQEIVDYQINLSRIAAQKEILKGKIQETQKELGTLQADLAEKQVEQDRLQQQLNLAQNTYNTFLQKYQETRITETARIGEDNIMVVAPAMVPEKPVAPRKMFNVAIATVLGVMVGVFTVFFMDFWKNTGVDAKTT